MNTKNPKPTTKAELIRFRVSESTKEESKEVPKDDKKVLITACVCGGLVLGAGGIDIVAYLFVKVHTVSHHNDAVEEWFLILLQQGDKLICKPCDGVGLSASGTDIFHGRNYAGTDKKDRRTFREAFHCAAEGYWYGQWLYRRDDAGTACG